MVTSALLFTGLVALVGLERLAELRLSARHAARAFARGGVEVGHTHYRVMTIFHALFLVACVAEVWLRQPAFVPLTGLVALAGVISAQGLRWWAIATLGERWNTRVIVWPDVEPVTEGPYRFVRHPNYLAVVVELCCLPLVHGAWVTAIVFTLGNAALLATRIRVEESALGPRWAAAFAARPRFLPEVRRG